MPTPLATNTAGSSKNFNTTANTPGGSSCEASRVVRNTPVISERSRGLTVGYFDQHQLETLDEPPLRLW